MWLVLCSASDVAAHWAYGELRRAGLAPLEIIAEDTLAMPLAFEHRIGERGIRTRMELANGIVLDSCSVEGVLNRITAIPARHMMRAPPAERDYALAELHALWVSWLHGLPAPVLNRPSPTGLCGAFRHVSEWRALGAAAGLEVAPYRLEGDDSAALHSPWEAIDSERGGLGYERGTTTVIVVGDKVLGDGPSEDVCAGCITLARLAGLGIMGITFERAHDTWHFLEATPLPDLRKAGPPIIRALLEALTEDIGVAA